MGERAEVRQGLSEQLEPLLIARMFLFALVVPVLAFLPLPRLTALLARVRVEPFGSADSVTRISRHADRALRPVRRLTRRPCLIRSITLYYFLRRAGVDVSIAFGMGRPKGELVGHCWLTRHGQPLCETSDPRLTYAELYRIPRC